MPSDVSADVLSPAGTSSAQPGAEFAEPWQARAFAMAVLASRAGCFTWSEWTLALSRELQRASDPQSSPTSYFECWLAALQSLLVGKGSIGQSELRERKDAWADACRRTPHGVPVSLPAADAG